VKFKLLVGIGYWVLGVLAGAFRLVEAGGLCRAALCSGARTSH